MVVLPSTFCTAACPFFFCNIQIFACGLLHCWTLGDTFVVQQVYEYCSCSFMPLSLLAGNKIWTYRGLSNPVVQWSMVWLVCARCQRYGHQVQHCSRHYVQRPPPGSEHASYVGVLLRSHPSVHHLHQPVGCSSM